MPSSRYTNTHTHTHTHTHCPELCSEHHDVAVNMTEPEGVIKSLPMLNTYSCLLLFKNTRMHGDALGSNRHIAYYHIKTLDSHVHHGWIYAVCSNIYIWSELDHFIMKKICM